MPSYVPFPGAIPNPGVLPVQFETPVFLLLLPLGVLLVTILFYVRPADQQPNRRRRIAFFASRIIIVALLATAAAGPYTVSDQVVSEEPSVRLLVDKSASMNIFAESPDELAAAIEAEGVPVQQTTIATGERSAIGDGVLSSLDRDTSIILFTDGRVTDGRTLGEAADLALQTNVTLNAVDLSPSEPETAVRISGPAKTSTGISNTFLLQLTGAALGDTPREITVRIGNETVHTTSIQGTGGAEFTHSFDSPGEYRITAEVARTDQFPMNNEFRKTVRVVDRPNVLYVSRIDYPLESFLRQHYNVTRAAELPVDTDLDSYYAVVIHDVAAGDLGNIEALHRFAIDGNGVVVVGGPNSYETGGYADSSIASMLPVRIGEYDRSTDIVLTLDISGSAAGQLPVIKSLALDALEQIGNQHRLGIVAFDHQAYVVSEFQEVGPNRPAFEDTILRLQSGGGTRIDQGLLTASDMLGGDGEVILISDGVADRDQSMAAARALSDDGVRVTTVGSGGVMDEELLRDIARATGRSYVRADQATKLRLLYGGADRSFSADQLTIVDDNHFITAGVDLTANPAGANEVTQKDGARYLVATGKGEPAVTVWRYGLGRVASITTFSSDGSLGELLQAPDSLLLSKTVNWAIGDPERKRQSFFEAEDTRVGDPATLVYTGTVRPTVSEIQFVRVGPDRYEASVTPQSVGFTSVGNTTFAVNAPREYASFGMSPAVDGIVQQSGGRVFAPDDAEAMAAYARSAAIQEQKVVTSWSWVVFLAALLVFLGEVAARRLEEVYGSNP